MLYNVVILKVHIIKIIRRGLESVQIVREYFDSIYF